VLVRVGPPSVKKTRALEAGLLEEPLREPGARLGAQAAVTKQSRSACSRMARTTAGAGGRGSCTRPGCSCRGSASVLVPEEGALAPQTVGAFQSAWTHQL